MKSVILEFWLKHTVKNADEIIVYAGCMAAILLIMRTYKSVAGAVYAALFAVVLAIYVFYAKYVVIRTKKKYLKQHNDYKALYISGMTDEKTLFFITQTSVVCVLVSGIVGCFVSFSLAESVAGAVKSTIMMFISFILPFAYVALYFVIQRQTFQRYFYSMLDVSDDELITVSQAYPLINEYTAVQNVALPIRIKHNMPKETAVYYALECMKELLLDRLAEIKPCELTNMQRVEIMIARIYVCEGWDISVSDDLMRGLTHIERKSVSMLLERAKKVKRRVVNEARQIDRKDY